MIKSLKCYGKGVLISGAFVLFNAVQALSASVPEAAKSADVVLLGEIHDNPTHHQVQAEFLSELRPKAVVWEMLTAEQAARIEADWLNDPERLEQELDWANSGWPDFALYALLFRAAQDALHVGAMVPRDAARQVMTDGAAAFFGAQAALYGLDAPLPEDEQTQREADQQVNHCNAMPEEMLPLMVDFQRLRDASLARAAVEALEQTGGPVAVITGNGHARKDRGAPVYLLHARPDLTLFALGQSEDGVTSGVFDMVLDAPGIEREDPCKAFEKQ